MPLQNRVTPLGDIIESPARGTFMGNRGRIHDVQKRIHKQFARKEWIICALNFGDRRRTIMAPDSYTELFFLDEVTALAAGHRPCGTCRKEAYSAFKSLWISANPKAVEQAGSSIKTVDKILHEERLMPDRRKRVWPSEVDHLPDGAMVTRQNTRQPLLVWRGTLLLWTPEGYLAPAIESRVEQVQVLTPPSVVNALKAGYSPVVHRSASA